MDIKNKTIVPEQNLSLMDKDELLDIIDKDFRYLWNLYVNKEEDFNVDDSVFSGNSSNSRQPVRAPVD